jgi:hypothetical protein
MPARPPTRRLLLPRSIGVTVPSMYALGRLLQLAGLVIPPLAILAQLADSIEAKMMLQFLVVAVGLFVTGYLMQQYAGGGRK